MKKVLFTIMILTSTCMWGIENDSQKTWQNLQIRWVQT